MIKRYFILLGLALWSVIFLGNCKYDKSIASPEEFQRVYMPQAGGNPVICHLTMTDTAQTLTYGADYGGIDYPDSDIHVHFSVSDALVDSFNSKNNTDYLILPDGSYSLEATDAIIPKGDLSTKPLSIKLTTIGKLEHGVQYLLPIEISTSGKIKNSEGLGVTYYLIDAKYDIIDVSIKDAGKSPINTLLNIVDTAQTISFTAQATTDSKLPEAINIKVAGNNDLVSVYNHENNTSYEQMPEGSFEFERSTGVINASTGESGLFKIKINTKGLLSASSKYLLPVQITEATADVSPSTRIDLNPDLATLYYSIQVSRNGIELTIVSYGKGSGYNDMEALAASVKSYNPDLLLIRELDVNTSRSGPANQPEILSGLLGMPYYVFANALDYLGGEYGSAIFSKYPIDPATVKTYMLSSTKSEKGPLAITTVKINGKYPLVFAGTHLNANAEIRNGQQVPELMDIMRSYTGPVILAGDFNANPSDLSNSYGVLTTLFDKPCQDCPPNYPASAPKSYSDYILYKSTNDFSILDYHIGQNAIGTHLPAVLKVKFYFDD